jgi:hypothetical protein
MKKLNEVIDEYIKAAMSHGEALAEGNSKKANSAYDLIEKNYNILRESMNDGLELLVGLLTHENNSVRLWAARHTLNYNSNLAEKVLSELGTLKKTPVAFDARMVLSEWKKGNLKF